MTDKERLTDAHLVLRCQLGEPVAFAELVGRLDGPLRYYVRRFVPHDEDAADIVQDVWLAVFRRVRSLREPAAVRPWIFRIAHSTLMSWFRRRAVRIRSERAWANETDDTTELPLDGVDVERLHAAIARLDDRHREVIVLMLVGELTMDEIGSVLQVSAGTIKSRVHHAKRHLKRLMEAGDV